MRFFRDFVSCCVYAADPTAAPTKQPLVPPPSRTLHRKKRDTPHWRPSLGAISEDAAPPHAERSTAVSGGNVKTRRRSSADVAAAAATAKLHHRRCSDRYDYGRVAMPAIMPTFSPTPFMF